MDTHSLDRPISPAAVRPAEGMAFLAENPEAFGFVADAYPLATKDLLIAADGYSADAGSIAPTYPVESGGVQGMLDTLYGGLMSDAPIHTHLLRHTFGEDDAEREHLIARYATVLAESTALDVLSTTARGASFEQSAVLVGMAVHDALRELYAVMSEGRTTPPEREAFSVSLGICRVTDRGAGRYTVDVFDAGHFSVYLLDAKGMRPLFLADTDPVALDVPAPLPGTTLTLNHPEPFALLLLSDGVSALNAAEQWQLREHPGRVWRYRMRLESYFLRLFCECTDASEFGERAAHFFTGRISGRDSASGAVTLCGDGDFESFRSLCRHRLEYLEGVIALLPDGYDPAEVSPPPDRLETENAYLLHLLEQEADLVTRTAEAVRAVALELLESSIDDALIPPPPSGAPDYRRLTREEVYETFRHYDCENDEDRARIEENRRILRENLAAHWITLRPLLATVAEPTDDLSYDLFCDPFNDSSVDFPAPASPRVINDRIYADTLSLNEKLTTLRTARQERLLALEAHLSDSLAILRSEGKDWLSARAGDDRIAAWGHTLSEDLPAALSSLLNGWADDSNRYRSLLAAYTAERDTLFSRDSAPGGFFAADWQGIINGTLPDERWAELQNAVAADPGLAAYAELLDALRRISSGTGARLGHIRERMSDRRMAQELANRPDLQLACLRAAAYRDPAWGSAAVQLLDDARRLEFQTLLRRRRETCDLIERRRQAYGAYREMYGDD